MALRAQSFQSSPDLEAGDSAGRLSKGQKRGKKKKAVVTGLYTITPDRRPPQEVVAALRQDPGRPEVETTRPTPGALGSLSAVSSATATSTALSQRCAGPRSGGKPHTGVGRVMNPLSTDFGHTQLISCRLKGKTVRHGMPPCHGATHGAPLSGVRTPKHRLMHTLPINRLIHHPYLQTVSADPDNESQHLTVEALEAILSSVRTG